jgi:hypothetical protein
MFLAVRDVNDYSHQPQAYFVRRNQGWAGQAGVFLRRPAPLLSKLITLPGKYDLRRIRVWVGALLP